jgi:hypothetical protein
LKRYKSLAIHLISAELIQGRGETVRSEIHKLNSVWNKEELPEHWKESVIVPVYKKASKTACNNYRDITATRLMQTVIRYPSFNVKSVCGRNY